MNAVPDALRRYPRSTREAYREWPENAIGISSAPVRPPRPPMWARLLIRLLQRPAR